MKPSASLAAFLALTSVSHAQNVKQTGSVAGQPNTGERLPTLVAPPLWWEAENASAGNFGTAAQNPFAPKTPSEAKALLGGAWIGVEGARSDTKFLEYQVTVARRSKYAFWTRKFWHHGPFRWRFGGQPWRSVLRDMPLADSQALRAFTGANWQWAGEVELAKGTHTLRIELLEKDGAAAFDCFVLSDMQNAAPFRPRGRWKLGEKPVSDEKGWHTFDSTSDDFKYSVLDLRTLNHDFAGQYGFLRRSGERFIWEKRPVETARFWGVTATEDIYLMEPEGMDYMARRLAKMGVNCVRLHLDFDETDAKSPKLRKIHRLVWALKRQGIYVGIGFYCLAVARDKPSWNLPELPDGQAPFAALFFYGPLQERYKAWARTLLTTPNPYTGLSLARDPAVAFVETVDEDNYGFWTFTPYENVPATIMPILEKRFGAWLTRKYGSVQAALTEWGSEKPPGKGQDLPLDGRVALYPAGLMTGFDWAKAQTNAKRARDQIQFLTEDLRAFWAGMMTFFQRDLGVGGLVYATNWSTADPAVLGPLDKWTNMSADFLAYNAYHGVEVKGPKAPFPFAVGQHWIDKSLLRAPENAGVVPPQYAGFPVVWTEGGWEAPNRFRAEGPLFMASQAAFHGIDGLMWFQIDRDWLLELTKWPLQTPSMMAQFPAAALLYRRGDVREAPEVISESLHLSDLYERRGAQSPSVTGLDSIRATQAPQGGKLELPKGGIDPGAGAAARNRQVELELPKGGIDPLSLYAGKVVRRVGENPGVSRMDARLSALVQRDKKRVQSATGELALDYGRGLQIIQTPRAQGAVGFLSEAGEVRLPHLTLNVTHPYGAVILISLDEKPLATSTRMLLQVMSEEKNSHSQIDDEMGLSALEKIGGGPLLVRDLAGKVALRRADAARFQVFPLNINGQKRPVSGAKKLAANGFSLWPDCYFYILERQ